MEEWKPKTELGRRVKNRDITDLNEILDAGLTILEPEITDTLMPDSENDLLMVGQSKGKFGGGRRRVFRQTQKKTREGNKPQFATYAVIGNGDGFVGLGYGKARETVPAREKAIRKAKLNIFKIARGSGSWESAVKEPHTIPFKVEGQCGSVRVVLMPAPKGKGLVAEREIQKILKAAGVQDVWSRTFGQTKNKINLIKATEMALRRLVTTKLRDKDVSNLSVVYGPINKEEKIAKQPQAPKKAPAPSQKSESPKVKKQVEASKPKAEKQEKAPVKKTDDAQTEKKADVKAPGLKEVTGIGPATAKKLREGGIMDAGHLANTTPKEIVELIGGSEEVAADFISKAKDVSGGSQ